MMMMMTTGFGYWINKIIFSIGLSLLAKTLLTFIIFFSPVHYLFYRIKRHVQTVVSPKRVYQITKKSRFRYRYS